jgi:hypothetical protein
LTILNAFVAPDVGLLATDGDVGGKTYGKIYPLPHISAAVAFRGSTGPAGRIALVAHSCGYSFDELAERWAEICSQEQSRAILCGDSVAQRGIDAVLVGWSPKLERIIGIRATDLDRKVRRDVCRSIAIADFHIPVPCALPELLQPRTVAEMFALGRSQIANAQRLMRGTEHEAAFMPGYPFIVAEIKRDSLNLHIVRA